MSQAGIISDTSAGGNDIRTLTGNSGGAVSGDGAFNVNLLGGAGVNVVGNPGTNTLTVSLTGGSAAIDSIGVDAFTAPGTNPVLPDALGLLTVHGAATAAGTTPVQSNSLAANAYTVQVQTSQAIAATDATKIGLSNYNSAHFSCDANGFVSLSGGGQAVDSLIPNSGTTPVVPAADGSITLQGTGSITTVGGLNSLTPQLTGLTNHSVQVGAGTATLTQLTVGTNGQVLIGATAADPAFATLTSSDSSITFTPGANTLSLQVAGGTTSIKTITGNSGGAESPSAGNFNILGTGSITVAGSANTETVQLTGLTNHAVQVGAGTATLTQVGPSATTGAVLASNGAAADPSFQTLSSLGATLSLNGNSGTATASSGTITVTTGASNANGTIKFTGSGSTLTLTASDGNSNTGLGSNALVNPSSTFNTALGASALTAISSGGSNCGIGALSLTAVSSGAKNTGCGIGSLQAMSTNSDATAVGFQALNANTGAQNTAVGSGAGATNTSGTGLTAIGYQALNASTGALNTAVGLQAGLLISSGQGNTICGASSGAAHTTGDFNCIFGYANGASLTTTASRNIFIGTGNTSIGASDSNIYLGINISATESNTLRIGSSTGSSGSQLNKAVICGIRGITTGVNDAVAVLVDSANQLGVTSSSRRYKNNILDITNSDKLHQLRPVQFNYPQFEASRPEYGLIAEEVESVFPEMVVYNDEGEPETLQYHKLYALMLAEIQRLNKRIDDLTVGK